MENEKSSLKSGEVHRNVYVILACCCVWGLADSIWGSTILSAWLYLLANGSVEPEFMALLSVTSIFFLRKSPHKTPNTIVGGIEAMQGLGSILTALPIGILADRHGRAPMCKIGGVGFIVATVLTVFAILIHSDSGSASRELVVMSIALVFWGIFGGVFSGPMQALFADSVPDGERSRYYALLQYCYLGPSIVGPILTIGLFQKYGDNWTFSELKTPFLIGISLELPVALLAFFLQDIKDDEEDEKKSAVSGQEETEEDILPRELQYNFFGRTITAASIPYILFFSDLCYSLGSGMTVKFFPLFFMNVVKLSPTEVQGIAMVCTVMLMGFSFMAQKMSRSMGRVQVVIFCRLVGIFLLGSISILQDKISPFAIVILYVLRTSFMNCAYPLDESILMDNVPKQQRSKWKSLESVGVFGWCGSALVGGIFADKYGYGFSFLITAFMQLMGCITYMLLLPIVADEKPAAKTELEKPLLERDETESIEQQESV